MAGFRSPLFLLGLGAAAAVTQAGYPNPLPVPPLGGAPTEIQGGFRSPLPVPPISADGTPVVIQGGFRSPLPVPPLSAGEGVEPPPEPVREQIRSGGYWREYWQLRDERAESDTIDEALPENDDEEVLLLFMMLMGDEYG